MKLKYPCFRRGHVPDPHFPIQTLVSSNEEQTEWYAFAVARCGECGGMFAIKKPIEKPSGLVGADGQQMPPLVGRG